ncbi:MAG: hypothetical protein Q4F24_17525, partial [Eubacteriales bacterium]|nr:hypothetical protein [Eubacteriales bacterium]
NNTFYRKVDFMIEKPTGEIGKKFSLSIKKVMMEKSALRPILENLGMQSEDIDNIVTKVQKSIPVAKVGITNNSLTSLQLHQYLTRCAMREDCGYMQEIKSQGREYCIFRRDDFKNIVKEVADGFRNHLEVLDNFQMLGILHTNPGRKDYRLTGGLPVYCFLPADEVTKDTYLEWCDAGKDAECPKIMNLGEKKGEEVENNEKEDTAVG